MDDLIRQQEFWDLMQELSIFNSVFLALWKMGYPTFTDEIPTAAVRFDEDGQCLQFLFNASYWDSITSYMRSFIICHECLHVILNHGFRSKGSNPVVANIALDIAVNHMLIRNFGFIRNDLQKWENYCWVETVFKDSKYKDVPNDRNFEYYYDLIIEDHELLKKLGALMIVDDHFSGDGIPLDIEDILDSINEVLTPKEIDEINKVNNSEYGGKGHVGEPLLPGTNSHVFKSVKITISPIWDKILKDIEKKTKYKRSSQFVFKNRRMTFLNNKFMIPNDYEIEMKVVSKPDLYFYLDCSGSCGHLKELFFRLSQTVDKKKYNVKLFARTTRVKEITKDSNGNYFVPTGIGGSDDFRCIENHIQKCLIDVSLKKYPVVIHLTDGGDCSGVMVKPTMPSFWYWFLSGNDRRWIPKECTNIYSTGDILSL
jgi:predicted metal-dependent peptidase